MPILEAEPIIGFIRRILPFGRLPPSDDGIEEYIDVGLERSNTERAEKIASRVRDNGIYRYGPMWAEYNGVLKDDRDVFLQASDDALVVHIASKGRGDTNVHIRWDRKQKIVNMLEIRGPDHNNQQALSRFEVSRNFASMLGSIEKARFSPLLGF
ncbi:MAG: hypothetical protein NT149_00520 [Candidatus Gottesmanbacteria bacterium]|nr:hypothetical protein [Candidatus Gottesmanbacteria bacterium]